MYFCGLRTRLISVGFMLLLSFKMLAQSDIDATTAALEKAGFANIRMVENDSLVVVTIQNDAYKIQASGIAAAIRILGSEGVLGSKTVKLIATSFDIPQVTLTYDPASERWNTTYKLDESWKIVRNAEKKASSFGKVDFAVYPQLSLKNLIINQVYQALWQISPALEVSLWPGGNITVQMKVPIHNGGYGALESKIHPGHITVSQRFRAPGDFFGRVTVGSFSNNRYGLALDLFHPLWFSEKWSLEANMALLGLCYWDGFQFHYSRELKPYWSLGVNYYWDFLKSNFTLKVQKFLLDDYGIKAEMVRQFRYCAVGFYLEKGLNSYARTNGGFRFSIALPPYRHARYRYVPRLTTAGNMGMTYNANNEQRWYGEYKVEARDNIFEHNAFNPYYINSEIVKLNN